MRFCDLKTRLKKEEEWIEKQRTGVKLAGHLFRSAITQSVTIGSVLSSISIERVSIFCARCRTNWRASGGESCQECANKIDGRTNVMKRARACYERSDDTDLSTESAEARQLFWPCLLLMLQK